MNAPINSAVDDREYAVPDVNFYSTFAHSPHVNHHLKHLPSLSSNSPYMCTPRLIHPTGHHCYPTLRPMSPHCCMHQPYLTIQTRHTTKSSNCQMTSCSPSDEFPSIEASCGNSSMVRCHSQFDSQTMPVKDIHVEHLTFKEKLGDGLFGSVHLAELFVPNHEKQFVIVKSLKDNVDEKHKLVNEC
jgi:hypothetical protein